MTQDSLFEKAQKHLLENLPFVLYKKPEGNSIIGIFQKDRELQLVNDYTEKGYAFAPFDGDEIVLIPHSISEIITAEFVRSDANIAQETKFYEDNEFKISHIQLVKEAIEAIKSGDFSKLVISRKEVVDIPDSDFIEIYKRLLNLYPDAFDYCFFHPEIGLWMGAFSEQLVCLKDDQLTTMAVAGTQKWEGSEAIIWGEKEKAEQKFVTDFIIGELKDITNNIQLSEPYTLKAGKLAHIKTDISANLNSAANLNGVLKLFHPTPAVCGLPKEQAKVFILTNENYDREYYSGFHGELNINVASGENQTDLYVNLRCMKIDTALAKATLFIGGGITKDSIPENEWTETVNKAQTMKRVLTINKLS